MTPCQSRRTRLGRVSARAVATVGAFACAITLVGPVASAVSPVAGTSAVAVATASSPVTPRRIVTGWMPYWTTNSSLAAIVANRDLFTEVSPFWYTTSWNAATGRTKIVSHIDAMGVSVKATATKTLAATRTRVVPSITDSTPTHRMSAVLRNSSLRAGHVAQIVSLVVSNGYAGIDLDYEKFAFNDGSSTWAATRPAWISFIRDLSRALHARHKILTVAVPEMFNNLRTGGSGYWVYDYAGMAPYVDRIRIMAYDYSWTVPGPIGPLPWAERIVKFAVSVMSPSKVQLGIPTYGRNWVRRDAANRRLVTGSCPVDNKADYNRYTYSSSEIGSFMSRVGVAKASVQWSATSKEHWFRYSRVYAGKTSAGAATSCRVYREVWFGDADSVSARMTLVGKYHLAGVAFWTLGGEDVRQWSRLRAYARSIASVPTSVSAAATKRVASGALVRIAARSTSRGKAVVGGTARLYWQRAGATTWQSLADAVTSATGWVTFARKAPRYTGHWKIVISGTWARSTGVSRPTNTSVNAAVAVRLTSTVVAAGKAVRLNGVVAPARAGQVVLRQRLVKGHWVTEASTMTTKTGFVSFRLQSRRHGVRYSYRLVANGTAFNSQGYSRVVVLRVV